MPPRTCIVNLTDSRGIRHSVEVQAESLYEAAGLALHALRSANAATSRSEEWVDAIGQQFLPVRQSLHVDECCEQTTEVVMLEERASGRTTYRNALNWLLS